MYYYGIPEGSSLAHAGKKGMKWGYNDGVRNGNRIAMTPEQYARLQEKLAALKAKGVEVGNKVKSGAQNVRRAAEGTGKAIKAVHEMGRRLTPEYGDAAQRARKKVVETARTAKEKAAPYVDAARKEAEFQGETVKRKAKRTYKKAKRTVNKSYKKTVRSLKKSPKAIERGSKRLRKYLKRAGKKIKKALD